DQALITVVKSGSNADRRAALPRLLKIGNPDALQLAIDLAHKGARSEKFEVMRLLADSGAPRAFDALLDIAGKSRGQTRVTALEAIAQARPGAPGLHQLLTDSLRSGRRDEASFAASTLGRLGTDSARQALVDALAGRDAEVASVAAA